MTPPHPAVALVAAAAIVAPASAPAAKPAPERFELGANSAGDPCSAARQWTVGEGVRRAGDQPFGITCRGIAAAEAQGYVAAPNAPQPDDQCGKPLAVRIAGIGPAEVRRCFDARLARPAVDIRFVRGRTRYQGAAVEIALGPLEAALRVVAAGARPPSGRASVKPDVALADLPAGPSVTATGTGAGITAEAALAEGVGALQAGRTLDASRALNDALRAFAGADAATKVSLRLAAGLADSNLSQFEAADAHFAAADLLIAGASARTELAAARRQLIVYRGLHLINQRRWAEAIATLQQADDANSGLLDPATLSRLNEEAAPARDTLQSTLTDASSLSRNLLEAQRHWAISVARLALGDVAGADAALAAAADVARTPVRTVPPERIAWMRAAIERQKGRIEARRGATEAALANFDCAVAAFQGARAAPGRSCVFPEARAQTDASVNAPLLVETQLERASIASRDAGRDGARVLGDYGAAVQSLSNLSGTGSVSLGALERYFALLVAAEASPERDEEFFRAAQTIGEPAIAREYAQLQKIVSADAGVADLLRQRGDLERQLIRLRYEIAASDGAGPGEPARDALLAERADADAKLTAVNTRLLAADGVGALEDQPATVASVRNALGPGEVYLKLVALRSAMFGIAIGRDRTLVYKLDAPLADIERRTAAVLTSARTDDEGVLRPFDVAGAERLFEIVAGPAAPLLKDARRVVYNPAGGLRQLPLAVLVADKTSVAAYQAQPAKGDYSAVDFFGRKVETATALSPRAFLRGRLELKPSAAPLPFLGLGENAAPRPAPDAAGARSMPFDCPLSYQAWAQVMAARAPVSAHEIGVAAAALGLARPPEIVRDDFTDLNLVSGPGAQELRRYQVLHFATHGIPETQVAVDGCRMRLAPALVTTLAAPATDGAVLSDGFLSFDEVARLRLDANLVVLSACETAGGASSEVARRRGLEDGTPALDGLVRSFIVANARAVLATFWRVPAITQSDELMAAFYRTGRAGPLAGALRTAQTEIMRQPRWSHPYYWGAYFLVGDGSKPMLSGTAVAAR